jgi:transposase
VLVLRVPKKRESKHHHNMNSIYTNADPQLLKLFEQAGHLHKVLCAPLDFAKKSHATLFCNGAGDVLKKSFHVPNTSAGVEQLVAEVTATCRHRAIQHQHVFFGGEDTPSYAENFTAELRRRGFLVARVNAFDAKKQRENLQASTDLLDLHGIAHCLLKGRARVWVKASGVQAQLRLLVRERDYLVRSLTALRNRLHTQVDRLFPGFLSFKQSGVRAHGPACHWLLREGFSAPQIARRTLAKLTAGLEKHRVPNAAEAAAQLRSFAASVLPPDPEMTPVRQLSLENQLGVGAALQEAIAELEPAIARLLAQSPAARLTTVPGLGVTLSAGVGAELDLLGEIPPLDRICSYAGIIPATQQSGGPDKEAAHKATYPHCNYRLKNYLLQAGEHMARISGTDASQLAVQAQQKGQHVLRVLGRHAAAVVRSLLLNERAYLPQALYAPQSDLRARGAYFAEYWPKLRAKWKTHVPHQQLFDPAQPLGRWRKMAQDAYGISLPLPGSNHQEQNQPKEPSTETEPDSLEENIELI